jgi:hypothetical protein
MACDTQTLPNQTLTQRKEEVREAVMKLAAALAAGKVKPVVGPQGAITFQGWSENVGKQSRVTDACAYRRVMATGSALAKMQIAKAEQLAGRTVSTQSLTAGHHSHDGGKTWGHH